MNYLIPPPKPQLIPDERIKTVATEGGPRDWFAVSLELLIGSDH